MMTFEIFFHSFFHFSFSHILPQPLSFFHRFWFFPLFVKGGGMDESGREGLLTYYLAGLSTTCLWEDLNMYILSF